MNDLREIKQLVKGNITGNAVAKDINAARERVRTIGDNSWKMMNALNFLQSCGISFVVNLNTMNCAMHLFSHDFEEVVHKGFYPSVKEGEGVIDFKGVRLIAKLSPEQVTVFKHLLKPFYFWYSGYRANSAESFKRCVEKVCVGSLEHHVYNNDFEKWFRHEAGMEETADDILALAEKHLEGEDLRKELLSLIP